MNSFRAAIVSLSLLVAMLAEGAVNREPFSETRFTTLQGGNALVLVDVWARWCPTCAAQKKVLERYAAEHPDSGLHILVVDFDEQKKWVRHFRAPRQSTLLLYRGEQQLWFSVAETDAETIFQTLNRAAR
mgnify:CR=1 FL=1